MKPYANYAISEQTPLRVVTYFWNDPNAKHVGNYQYTADHVRKLHSMWKRNTTRPFTFHVVTDKPEWFDGDEHIDAIPIHPWRECIERFGRCYVKLSIFGWWAREYFGPCKILTLDLDMVITGNVDGIIEKGEQSPFTGCRATHSTHGQTRIYGGAMHMHSAGEFRHIWDTFRLMWKLRKDASEMTGSDQLFMTTVLGEDRWPSWEWNEDGIYDFRSIQGPEWDFGDNVDKDAGKLPENARIVLVSGYARDPSQTELREQFPWIKEHWV